MGGSRPRRVVSPIFDNFLGADGGFTGALCVRDGRVALRARVRPHFRQLSAKLCKMAGSAPDRAEPSIFDNYLRNCAKRGVRSRNGANASFSTIIREGVQRYTTAPFREQSAVPRAVGRSASSRPFREQRDGEQREGRWRLHHGTAPRAAGRRAAGGQVATTPRRRQPDAERPTAERWEQRLRNGRLRNGITPRPRPCNGRATPALEAVVYRGRRPHPQKTFRSSSRPGHGAQREP